MLLFHERYWPVTLETIVKDLPNMERFRIHTKSLDQPSRRRAVAYGLVVTGDATHAVFVSNRIINVALARTVLWKEGYKINIDDLTIQPPSCGSLNDIKTSDVITDDHRRYFGQVDREGYQTKGRRSRMIGRKKSDGLNIDDMIKRGRRQHNRDAANIQTLEVGLNAVPWLE